MALLEARKTQTLKELGKKYGVGQERIRQVCMQTERALRWRHDKVSYQTRIEAWMAMDQA